jgi:hypothetical protein
MRKIFVYQERGIIRYYRRDSSLRVSPHPLKGSIVFSIKNTLPHAQAIYALLYLFAL